MPMPQLKVRAISPGLDIALRLEEGHQPRLRPGVGVDPGVEALGQDARDVLEQAAAGDVGERARSGRARTTGSSVFT